MLLVPFYRQANRGSGYRVIEPDCSDPGLEPRTRAGTASEERQGSRPLLPEPCGDTAPGSLSLPFSPAPLPAQALPFVLGLEEDPGDSFLRSPLDPALLRGRRTPPACLLLKGAVPLVRP